MATLPLAGQGAPTASGGTPGNLAIGARRVRITTAQTRLQLHSVYQTVIFVLESVVFSLIGLQLPTLIRALSPAEAWPTELAASQFAADDVIDRARASLQPGSVHPHPHRRDQDTGTKGPTSSAWWRYRLAAEMPNAPAEEVANESGR